MCSVYARDVAQVIRSYVCVRVRGMKEHKSKYSSIHTGARCDSIGWKDGPIQPSQQNEINRFNSYTEAT